MIAEIRYKNVDAVCEISGRPRSRFPSRNPDVDELTAGKPRMVVLNRVDQADGGDEALGRYYFRGKGYAVLESDAKKRRGDGEICRSRPGAAGRQAAGTMRKRA